MKIQIPEGIEIEIVIGWFFHSLLFV
jgi:hypothetical protein